MGLNIDRIIALLASEYGIESVSIEFLPLGADPHAVVYRVNSADGKPYFLKVKRGAYDEVGAALTHCLHQQNITCIIAPLLTKDGKLSVLYKDFMLQLAPYIEGHNGFHLLLSKAQWRNFGAALRHIQEVVVPTNLRQQIPVEDYSPQWRERTRRLLQSKEQSYRDDPIVAQLYALLESHRFAIEALLDHAEQCAERLRNTQLDFVLCHTDIHAGNVLLASDGELYLVDWDAPRLAPKERDLMFIGGGIGGRWYEPEEADWFYEGYGETSVDTVALAYYRNERIIEDIAVYAEEILPCEGSNIAARTEALEQLAEMFHPVVEIAERTYQQIA